MFKEKMSHVCAISEASVKNFLPPLLPTSSFYQRSVRFFKEIIIASEVNPRCLAFFRTTTVIYREQRKQIKSGSWIIHPFSIFRVYYEMWMAIIYFTCMIYMPLDASYKYLITVEHSLLDLFLCASCIVDICINFRTGYLRNEDIVMNPKTIAKHYVFGRYFIFDLLSSMPEMRVMNTNHILLDVVDYMAMLKIVRIGTFFTYTTRTLDFFKATNFTFLAIRIFLIFLLVTHYVSCILYVIPVFIQHSERADPTAEHVSYRMELHTISKDFINTYLNNSYLACSLLLAVETQMLPTAHWASYLIQIFVYIIGKFLLAFLIILILGALSMPNRLEFKFSAMMSQLDSFMAKNKLPMLLQKRLRQYYSYKYGYRYFNEPRIEKYISEKIRHEIKYHACAKLISNISLFRNVPQHVLENILLHLKQEIYLVSDVIIQFGTPGDGMYFLASGTVEVLSPSGKEICHLMDGDYFGEICLVTQRQITTATVVALETCEVYKLDRKSFKKCIPPNTAMYKELQDEAKRRYLSTKDIEMMFQSRFASL